VSAERNIIHVKIGEVRTGRRSDVLKATLGSCVGIGLFWKQQGLYGLAHCFLPEGPANQYELSARFATQALPSLIMMMKIRPANRAEIEAVVAGGGNMTQLKDGAGPHVGDLNSQVVLRSLQKAGIRIIFQDVGGTEGRQIEIDCRTGSYEVHRIPRIMV
jgi:chemotaxis protein CheD